MSRLFYGMMVVVCLSICPLTIGCGGSGPDVIEQTASPEELERERQEYEKEQAAEAAKTEKGE